LRPDEDEYLDEEAEPSYPRSLLASGWVRALLVLGALVLLLFVSLPYVLRSMDRGRPAEERVTAIKPAATQAAAPAPPSAASTTAPAPPKPSPASPRALAPAGHAKEAVAPAAPGEFWVQAGAFQEEKNAERLAERLGKDKVGTSVSRITRGGEAAGRHELFVTGANVGAVNTALQGKGSAKGVAGGVVVEPPLDLKDAVALSKRLAAEGFTVKIRRLGEGAPATFHVVSVGPYPTRARAETAAKELTVQGLRGFVRQGPAR
jgi:cell division septation protein DedD